MPIDNLPAAQIVQKRILAALLEQSSLGEATRSAANRGQLPGNQQNLFPSGHLYQLPTSGSTGPGMVNVLNTVGEFAMHLLQFDE